MADGPAVFVFDEPLLDRLRLSAKRLVFIAETLAESPTGARCVAGDPVDELHGVAPGVDIRTGAWLPASRQLRLRRGCDPSLPVVEAAERGRCPEPSAWIRSGSASVAAGAQIAQSCEAVG